jgi:folate-dependent phosphoribosylglycinamide formyltransferase PurN
MEKQPWITFFSQTGSEIADLAESLGYWPSRIITNKRPGDVRTIDPRIIENGYLEVSNKPSERELLNILQYYNDPIITLHGWLRIMPPNLCTSYNIYNGHPGLITQYPELKGKDPQIKAFNLKHEVMGCVIHKVTAGVDEGKVLKETFFNAWEISEEDMWKTFKDRSCYLWNEFLEELVGKTK